MDFGDRDRLDTWLDVALEQYVNAEPTPGLERRILANTKLGTQRSHTKRGSLLAWRCAFGGATLAACLVAVWWHGDRIHRRPELPAVVVRVTPPVATAVGGLKPPPRYRRADSAGQRYRTSRSQNMRAAAQERRLQQFPSPRRLSEQEQLLLICVQSRRDAAIFMAQAQTEFRERGQQEIERLSSESDEAQTPE